MNNVLFIILIVVVIIVAMLGIPYLMMKRAMGRVIKILRNNYAIDARSAKTADELGLRPRTRLQGMFRARDYKPQALNFLIKSEIVQLTENGRIYLSEDKLAASKLARR